MPALILVLLILSLSLLVNRIATIALVLTGLSRASASFQARSAFTGVGFATQEAEKITNHPVRRRIIMWLMLIGNIGIVTTMASLLVTFLNAPAGGLWLRLGLLSLGSLLLLVLVNSKWIDRYLSRLIRWAFRRWSDLDVRDYNSLLHLSGNYRVTELEVNPKSWLANHQLLELRLRQEGIVVLGIKRQDGKFIGAPKGKTEIRPYDTLILYGQLEGLSELGKRRLDASGDRAHQQAVRSHNRTLLEAEEHQPGQESSDPG